MLIMALGSSQKTCTIFALKYTTQMELDYRINLVGHDAWLESGYAYELASGDVVTSDGEIIGEWRVVRYDPEQDHNGGCYEFVADGQEDAQLFEKFAFLDYRVNRAAALIKLIQAIQEWHENQ
jgi:hypothetical protein